MVGMIVGGQTAIIDLTLSTDTIAYASGDLIADTQALVGALRLSGGSGMIQSIIMTDEDDQGVAMDLYFLEDSTSLGTENGAPNISDANSRTNILGRVSIATSDYSDLGGVKVAYLNNLGMAIKSASGSNDIYVAAVNSTGTPTFTASGLKLRVSIFQD